MGLRGVTPEIIDVEGSGRTHPHPGLDKDEPGHMLGRRVLVLCEVREDVLGSVDVDDGLARILAVREGRRRDLLEQPRSDRVDRLAPLDEHTKRVHLGLLADRVQVRPTPNPVLVEILASEVGQVVDSLLVTPPDEEREPRPMGIDRRLPTVPTLVLQVQLYCPLRRRRFQSGFVLIEELPEEFLRSRTPSD